MDGMSKATYPVKQIAGMLMLSERRVQQLAAQGVIPKADSGKYELVGAVQGYIKFLQERSIGNASAGGEQAPDYHAEKARKIKAEADLAELSVASKRGQLVDARAVEREAEMVMLQIRSRMLAIADRLTPLLLGEVDERVIKDAIVHEVEEALTALSETADLADEDEDAADEDDE